MANIASFPRPSLRPERVSLPQVVTQPYDKINPQMQENYYASSPYNLVRIILGKRMAADDPRDNPYSRAAELFRGLATARHSGAGRRAVVYSYSQRFTVPGTATKMERRGFIGLGRLEDYSAQVVFRHEQTLAKPKADRLDLLRATRAHFGQIFMLYSDPAGEIEAALAAKCLLPTWKPVTSMTCCIGCGGFLAQRSSSWSGRRCGTRN